MNFDQAQAEFQRIIRGIAVNCPLNERLNAQLALDALTNQLRGRDGFDSLRASIDEAYKCLVADITAQVLQDLQSRDEIYKRASEKFTAIAAKAGQNAKMLSLEKTKIVLPALNQSVDEVKGIIAALKNRDPEDALIKGQSLLALIEKVKEDVSKA